MRAKRLVAVTILVLSSSLAHGQTKHAQPVAKTAIRILHNGDDPVGAKLVYKLREEITKSVRYQLAVEHPIAPGSMMPTMEIVSVDDEGGNGKSSAISILLRMDIKRPVEQITSCGTDATIISGHWIIVISADRIDDGVMKIMTYLDDTIPR